MAKTWWIWGLITAAGLGVVVIIADLAGGSANLWSVVEADLGKFVDQCELPVLERFARQRWGAMTNLSYLAVGAFILFRALGTRGGYRTLGATLGASTLFLGLGSYLFHASMTKWGQTLDIMGIYAVLGALVGLVIWRFAGAMRGTRYEGGAWGWLALLASFGLVGIARRQVPSTYVMFICIGIIAILFVIMVPTLWWGHEQKRQALGLLWQFGAAAGVFMVAGLLQMNDGYDLGGTDPTAFQLLSHPDPTKFAKWACVGPTSLFQAHALWHVFGGLAILGLHDTFAPPNGRVVLPPWD